MPLTNLERQRRYRAKQKSRIDRPYCSFEGCDKFAAIGPSSGLCEGHITQRRRGYPLALLRKPRTVTEKSAAQREAQRRYKEKHPDRVKQQSRVGHEKFKDRERAQARQYYAKNRERLREQQKAWFAANPGYSSAWWKKHPAGRCAKTARRRALRFMQRCGCCTEEQIKELYAQTALCGGEVDHTIPLTLGGHHCTKNLQPLTDEEHRKKTSFDLRNIAASKRRSQLLRRWRRMVGESSVTIYGPNGGVVVGQPLSPFFGAQNGANAAAPIIEQPTQAPIVGGMQATGVQMSLLEACSRGLIPRNTNLSTVSGQAVSAGISALQGDGMSVDEGLASGNGAQINLGVAVAPNANNPNSVTTMGVNNQVFVEGTANSNDSLSTGPTPTNMESVVSAPLPGSITTANVGLLSGVFQG